MPRIAFTILALTLLGGAIGCGDPSEAADYPFEVRESVGQLHITHAPVGERLRLYDPAGALAGQGDVDHLGSLVFRELAAGDGYHIGMLSDPTLWAGPFEVMSIAGSRPTQSFYSNQRLAPGFGYVETRDGTTLSVYVTLPGPIAKGPYPTVINYSGYDPSRPGRQLVPPGDILCDELPSLCDSPSAPTALIASLMGYATVGINMRGTGCSGGAYDFFEPLQILDGYDAIETVAAQSWVEGHRVGMVGLSFPGISQLFVAQSRPPSLAAITPLSTIGSTHDTLIPGGILNNGFALIWMEAVLDRAAPYGQGWEQARVDAGDEQCQENQLLHDQRVDVIAKARAYPYYVPEVVDPVNPERFVGNIEVPVFFAGSWQDEQTGPYFSTLLDRFSSAPVQRHTVYGGVHPDCLAPQVLTEWKQFLDIYVAQKIPKIEPLAADLIVPQVFNEIFGVAMDFPPLRFANAASYDEARSAFEAEAPYRVIFENGAGGVIGAPDGTFERHYDTWPPASVIARRWYLHGDGSLQAQQPTATSGFSSFTLDPAEGQRSQLAGGDVWALVPNYSWCQPSTGLAVAWSTPPLVADTVMLGSASVDLWISSTVEDADLEVTVSEVRPDGQEMYVQSGWLRASRRVLNDQSSELWPVPTHREQDEAPLVPGEWVEVRVAIPAFGHIFRAGSQIRLVVDTPGCSRTEWLFETKTFNRTARHSIGHSVAHPSSVLFSVVDGMTVPTPLPACPSLRGQPCRPYQPFTNR